jgi:prefoldin subunit 5
MKERKMSEKQLMGLIRGEEKRLKVKRDTLKRLAGALDETNKTLESIEEIEKNPEKVLMKLGSGVMIEVNINDTKKVTRAFSQRGYLNEDTKDTKKWLKTKKKSLESKIKETNKTVQKIHKQLGGLVGIAKKVREEKRKLAQKNIATK